MSNRKAMSKTTRFEVFKRDSFTCQYCGAKAPDVVLEIEHIHPVSKGGDNDIMNLVTSCEACNDGKAARTLDDKAVVEKARRQLENLQERREQLEGMLAWREGLRDLNEDACKRLAEYIGASIPGYELNEPGANRIRQWLAKYSLDDLMQAADISMRQYLRHDADGRLIDESVLKAWEYIGKIAGVRHAEKERPGLAQLIYARAIARRRCGYFNDDQALDLLRSALDAGAHVDDLVMLAKRCRNWSSWRNDLEDLIADLKERA